MGPRSLQFALISSLLLACWLGMQAIHELGHVLGAVATGGQVGRVVLHPLTISRTDLHTNPHPLVVVWCGPVWGSLVPTLVWWFADWREWGESFLLRFFAGFCLLANGLYMAVGSFEHVGDCGDMLRQGTPIWALWLFGAVAAPVGLWLWHGQGKWFGIGPNSRKVETRIVWISSMAAVLLLLNGLWIGGR